MALTKGSKWSGWLDLSQSISGMILAIFLWTHLILISSILFGADAMAWVARTMELSFLSDDGHGYPWVVTLIAIGVALLAAVHVLVVMHKLPLNLKQQKALSKQMRSINHGDTKLWYWQAVTGVIILILLPIHLWLIGAAPETVGPQGSADRIWNQGVWLVYLPLLVSVEIHAAVGVYRVLLKWGVTESMETRHHLKRAKSIASGLFILIGLASLAAFWTHAS